MNSITQHIPSFVDYRSAPPKATFDTAADLGAVDFVARYKNDPDYGFFAQQDSWLIATSPGGSRWLVVGHMASPVDFLPEWTAGKRGELLP